MGAAGPAFNRAVTHGDQLLVTDVGPWALQAVPKGSESLDTVTVPPRGYWLISTADEWRPNQTYVYNNNPANKGGIVPAGGLTIDGYSVPAGTNVAQFRDLSGSDFSAQGQGGNYLFRGCRFRNNAIGQSSQFNDFTATYTNRLFYCDMGSISALDVDYAGAFWKAIGGSGHVVHRTYFSYQYVTFQPNVPNCSFIENYVHRLIYYGGDPALGDPGFVIGLHRGRKIFTHTAEKVRAFMADYRAAKQEIHQHSQHSRPGAAPTRGSRVNPTP